MVNLAVLVSGTGTILKAILQSGLSVLLVIADRECPALTIARSPEWNVPYIEVIRRADFSVSGKFDRVAYTVKIVEVLQEHNIDLVAMAGFMTILDAVMFEEGNFPGRVLNTHPSLLPKYPGGNAVDDALKDGALETGCTIHIATEKLDDDKYMIAQEIVQIYEGDTEDELHERIKKVERVLYPKAIREYAQKLGLSFS